MALALREHDAKVSASVLQSAGLDLPSSETRRRLQHRRRRTASLGRARPHAASRWARRGTSVGTPAQLVAPRLAADETGRGGRRGSPAMAEARVGADPRRVRGRRRSGGRRAGGNGGPDQSVHAALGNDRGNVDVEHWGGPIVRGCGLGQRSGYALLRAAGFTTAGDQHDGPAFICRVGNAAFHAGTQYPTPGQEDCVFDPAHDGVLVLLGCARGPEPLDLQPARSDGRGPRARE